MSGEWCDEERGSLADALDNLVWATGEMRAAQMAGTYSFDPVHVRADIAHLRGEALRAKRQRGYERRCEARRSAEQPEREGFSDDDRERPLEPRLWEGDQA